MVCQIVPTAKSNNTLLLFWRWLHVLIA